MDFLENNVSMEIARAHGLPLSIYNHIYETYIIYIYKYIDVYIIHIPYLGSGFKYFLFSPLLGEMIQID